MASTTFNGWLDRVRGRFGNIVFKMRGGSTFIARMPAPSTAAPTPALLAVRERFRLATAYARGALGNPLHREAYRQRAKDTKRPVTALAVGDYLHPRK